MRDMRQVEKLIDVVTTMESLDEGATIYVGEPWASESPAIVEVEASSGGLPEAATKARLKYFLEVFVAREFLAGWESGLDKAPSAGERCDRLIRYAVDDA
jgi:hypothetical protein